MIHIALVGSGTGGHFYPLIAVTEILKEKSEAIALRYYGPNEYDKAELDRLGIEYSFCPAGKLRRYFSILNLLTPFYVVYGVMVALIKLYIWYPDAIMSKGGYTSVPIVFAAWLLRIPIVAHESDVNFGRANKFANRLASITAVSYQETLESLNKQTVVLTGIPIRQAFFSVKNSKARELLKLDPKEPVILIMGGSLGSEKINGLILDSLDELIPHYTLLHQTGKNQQKNIEEASKILIQNSEDQPKYKIYGVVNGNDYAAMQNAADLIISRAGSTSIAEIALQGKPSILIPIPESVSHDQRTNAYAYATTGAASVIEEKNMTDGLLVAEINRIMSDADVYAKMTAAATAYARPKAAELVATEILKLTNH